ncbi:GNAT family N-acetyltransferase [Sediminibacillus halophilus]|uniref:Acetyltransferase (GNAT) domain-containing protein n=1 Tax=Sediminibacillus halophilus TaxID=482461 RepID=A0A1G9LP74_9BACI|nr:GNAT family N-acetyltransferase [Sediminibacillus halophilus]SDL63822.1 Acetyltransferase (GNAT) domain-containing protein [Sediminibacillus halophilus]
MIEFIRNTPDRMEVEKRIVNSQQEYNLIANGKRYIDDKDIFDQYTEAQKLKVSRYLVRYEKRYVGILDFGMTSPRQQKPWISLFLIAKDFQRTGIARKTYQAFEEMLREKQTDCIQIAVHAENKRALRFWNRVGFTLFQERIYKGKRMYSMEKQLKDPISGNNDNQINL